MTALWIPGVVKQPLAIDHNRDKFIIPAGDVFHVAVSEATSLLKSYENRNDGIESTGYILRNGEVQQYRPLNVECDAQLAGNSWLSGGKWYGLNSWETQGMGEGDWTDAQLASIKQIISWKHLEYGTPLRLNPGPNSSGFGYHRLFKAWNPNGHSCPGPDRVKQFNNIIVPWMRQGGNEDDVTPQDKKDIAAEVVKGLLAADITNLTVYGKKVRNVDGLLSVLFNQVGGLDADMQAVKTKLDKLAGGNP